MSDHVTPPNEPIVAPAAEPVAAPAVVEAAVAAPVEPVVAPMEVPAAPVAHTETPSLLEGAGTEAPKPEANAAAPVVVASVEPVAPAYEAFTLPDGLEPDPAKMTVLTELLGKHTATQEFGQDLINLHTAAMQEYAVHLATEQQQTFADMRKQWREQIKGDERLGGASFETTSRSVARMRDMFVPDQDRAAFNDFLRITGAGDHPAFWKLLANAARHFDEPSTPPPNPRPPADVGRLPKNGRGNFYDHPSSAGRGQ